MFDRNHPCWYPLRVSYTSDSRLFKLKDMLDKEPSIEQTYIPLEYRTKNFQTQLVPAINNIIFVRSTFNNLNDVRHATNQYEPLRYIMRPVIDGNWEHSEVLYVPDKMMDQFIRVTNDRSSAVIFLDNPKFAFKPGVKARITQGLYAGVVGEVKRIQKNLCLVVAIHGVAAAAILHVPRQHLHYLSDEEYAQLTS